MFDDEMKTIPENQVYRQNEFFLAMLTISLSNNVDGENLLLVKIDSFYFEASRISLIIEQNLLLSKTCYGIIQLKIIEII